MQCAVKSCRYVVSPRISVCIPQSAYYLDIQLFQTLQSGNIKGESITVLLTSCLTGLDQSVSQIKTKIVISHTADSKPFKQEVNGTVILPPLVFSAAMGINEVSPPCQLSMTLLGLIKNLRTFGFLDIYGQNLFPGQLMNYPSPVIFNSLPK